jgi:nitrate reductase molybdenum cofactor assembly chaperone NarJ/NarW
MANSYRALAVLLSYPTSATAALMPAVAAALEAERLVPAPLVRKLTPLLNELSADDLYDAQSRYVDLFDRTRSLSLQLYEHVHGESRDRGQAMVELLKLYSSRGLELTAKELPDHLPVFLEFLSQQPADEAAVLLGEAAHVLEALRERLKKRQSAYAQVFDALLALADAERNGEAIRALMQEPDDDPNDLEALDKAWAEEQVTFGPDKAGCPKAEAMIAQMKDSAA